MPRIELSNNPALRFDFLAHLVWPNESDKRSAYIALIDDASISILKDSQRHSPFEPIFAEGHYQLYVEAQLDQFAKLVEDRDARTSALAGGFGLESFNKEMDKKVPLMWLAGSCVIALDSMVQNHATDPRLRSGPGIKKAQEVVSDIYKSALTTTETAWLKFKPVSHFLAAAAVVSDLDHRRFFENISNPDKKLIGISEHFRSLLTTYIPAKRNSPLVRAADLWLPPVGMESNIVPVETTAMPDELLDVLAKRTAR